MLFEIPLSNITADDILNLERNEILEDKYLDYKECVYQNNSYDKDEFRKDVTAFANASGGDIIMGIKEVLGSSGKTGKVVGLENFNEEVETQRLYDLLKDHVWQRVSGVAMRRVDIPDKNPVLIVRIPRSFNPPHQVTTQAPPHSQEYQYWLRNNAGSIRMDVDDLRNAFLMSETQAERIRNFRAERLGKILTDDTFLPMQPGAKVVLHLVPQGAFGRGTQYDVRKTTTLLNQRSYWGANYRYNFDGFFNSMEEPLKRYLQVYRNGILETVATDFCTAQNNQLLIETQRLVVQLITQLPTLLAVQQELGVEPPVFLMLSLVGVREYCLNNGWGPSDSLRLNVVPTPEVMCETFDVDAPKIWKPAFDTLWNTAGYDQCEYYDAEGNYQDPIRSPSTFR